LTACSCRLGAIHAGMDDEVVEHLTKFGRNLGIAFQIADDLLDLMGEETLAGKSLGSDLEQQKLTLPLIHLLQNGSAEQAARARSILTAAGNHKREALLPELQKAGSLDYARQKAEAFASSALVELECLPLSPGRTILEALADRVVHRDH
jgi:octaprenyl-diphosphate synthase